MADLQKGTTFTDGVSIANAANLNNLMDLGQILPAFINSKTDLPSPSTGVEFVVYDAGTLKKVTLSNLASVITGSLTGVVHGKTAITDPENLDEFILWQNSAAAEKKITYASLIAALEADLDFNLPTILTGTATVNPGEMEPDDNETFNVTVTGATTSNTPAVFLGFSIDYPDGVVVEQARVSAANNVLVSLRNTGNGIHDINSHTVRAVVFQY